MTWGKTAGSLILIPAAKNMRLCGAGMLSPGEVLFLAGSAGLCLCGGILLKGRVHLRVEAAGEQCTDDK